MASPLETLYILLKADVSDLKKKFEDSEKETKKLQGSLDSLDKTNEKVGHSFLNIARSVGQLITASAAATFAISGIKHALDFGIDLNKTSQLLGVSSEELNAWGNAVELAGGDAKQFQGTLKSLADKFGASPTVALKALPLYADLFSKLSPARAQQVGKQLGIDEGTILLLQQGRREIEDVIKRQKELGVVTVQDSELYGKFRVSLTETNQASQRFFNELAILALPTLIRFQEVSANAFNYFTKHPDFLAGALKAIEIAVGGLSAAFVVANPLIAAFAASLAAIAAAYEDIKAFLKGGKESLLGEITGVGTGGYPAFKKENDAVEKELKKLSFGKQLLYRFVPGYNPRDLLKHNEEAQQYSGLLSRNSLLSSTTNNSPQINYHLGPTTIETQATDGEGLLTSLQNYTNGQFAQANNFYSNGVKA